MRNWGLVEVQGFAQRVKEPGKRNLIFPDFSLYSSCQIIPPRKSSLLSTRGGKAFRCSYCISYASIAFQSFCFGKGTPGHSKKRPKFRFLTITSQKICHKGNVLLQTQAHLGKNTGKHRSTKFTFQSQLTNPYLRTGIPRAIQRAYSTSFHSLLCHVIAIHSFTCVLFVSLAGL